MHPPCFDTEEQYVVWVEADRHFHNRKFECKDHTFICTDCTPSYAEKMRECGRCQHENVVFERRNGELMGVPKNAYVSKYSAEHGVSWHMQKQQWEARIQRNGVKYLLGYFKDEGDAVHAYEQARRKLDARTA